MTAARLNALVAVAEAAFQRDTAEISRLRERDNALRERIAALRQEPRVAAKAFQPGPVARWERMVTVRTMALQRDRAALAPEIETARQRARQSFGRWQALRELAARQAG